MNKSPYGQSLSKYNAKDQNKNVIYSVGRDVLIRHAKSGVKLKD